MVLSLVYLISKLVYPNCAQVKILAKSCDASQLFIKKSCYYN